jgi:hypothetical protein
VETGEITPTMKLKRNVVHDSFADYIAAIYAKYCLRLVSTCQPPAVDKYSRAVTQVMPAAWRRARPIATPP